MTISLLPLPYADTALEPAISATTLQTHHGKHHKAYVDKTNAALVGGDHTQASLADIIAAAAASDDKGLFNNAAQVWNHGFYWHSLSPEAQTPTDDLAAAIYSTFGSFDALKEELAQQGAAHFASGWLWLVSCEGLLSVEQTHDAATFAVPGANGNANPLLVIDLWEHAYYIDHKNVRADYLSEVIAAHLAWNFASANLARGTPWTYPA
jgi:Fe-Mn family superoxide dismutase